MSEEKKKVYYYCAVPKCVNTSTNQPAKKFFSSPSDQKRRKVWLKKMRRGPKDLSAKTTFFVCEGHFNLEVDLKNVTAFKYGKYTRNALKPTAVPSLFHCQNEDSLRQPRISSVHRSLKKIVHEALAHTTPPMDEAVSIISPNYEDEDFHIIPSSSSFTTQKSSEKSTQTQGLKHFRSKYVQCDLLPSNSPSPKRVKLNVAEVLGFSGPEESLDTGDDHEDMSDVTDVESDDVMTDELVSGNESEESSNVSIYSLSECSLDTTFDSTSSGTNDEELWYMKRSREYTGITKESLHIIDVLTQLINCDPEDVYVVLVNIRKNYTNVDLGDRFQMNEKRIRSIFAKFLPSVAEVMKQFILWPTSLEIKLTLPITFRRNFRGVQAIIDAFEIEIQKPSDPVLQALTWSDYKKCNTFKYLVASAPNGQAIFISNGFGGRTSDTEPTQRSGFMSKLPKGAVVLADRGFKGVESVLREKGCTLVRPPSVKSGTKMTNSEVRQTKQIASIRIHIERAIRRLREFYLLKPHSCIHHDMLKYLDHCVIIACGIANLQPALIRYT